MSYNDRRGFGHTMPKFVFEKAQYVEALARLKRIEYEITVSAGQNSDTDEFYYAENQKYSKANKRERAKDSICGCYRCLRIFNPKEIRKWTYDSHKDALCPHCGKTAIIREGSGYPITARFLRYMNKREFCGNSYYRGK